MKLLVGRACKLPGVFVLVLLLFSVVSGCRTIDVIEYPDAEGKWKYRVDITRPNTENEGRRGYLFYRGRELAGHFSTIIIGETKYDYTISIDPWDFGGYAKDPAYSPPTSTTSLRVEREEQKRGWYFASANQRRQDTPADWIWVKRENLEAFVDPDKLYLFINKYELTPEPEKGEPPVQFRFIFESRF